MDPPLTSIPKTKTWFCPSCRPKQSAVSERATQSNITSEESTSNACLNKSTTSNKITNSPKTANSKKVTPIVTKKESSKHTSSTSQAGKKSASHTTKKTVSDATILEGNTKVSSRPTTPPKGATRESSRSAIKLSSQTKGEDSSNTPSTGKSKNSKQRTTASQTEPNKGDSLTDKELLPFSDPSVSFISASAVSTVTSKLAKSESCSEKEELKTPVIAKNVPKTNMVTSESKKNSSYIVSNNDKTGKAKVQHNDSPLLSSLVPHIMVKPIAPFSSSFINADHGTNQTTYLVDNKSAQKSIAAAAFSKDDKDTELLASANNDVKKQSQASSSSSLSKKGTEQSTLSNDPSLVVTDSQNNNDNPINLGNLGNLNKPQRSRSGRNIKRNSFHDEVEEGEQHLRSSRYAVELQKKTTPIIPQQPKKAVEETESIDKLPKSNNQDAKLKSSTASLTPPKEIFELKQKVENPIEQTTPTPNPEIQNKDEKVDTAPSPKIETIPNTPVAETLPNADVNASAPDENMPISHPNSATATIAPEPVPSTEEPVVPVKVPRRKPGARECMQISRRFGVQAIPQKYMDTLLVSN